MRVQIQVHVYEGDAYTYYGSQLAETEAAVSAEPGALDTIPWDVLCAGLAQRAIAEAKAKIEEETE